MYMEFLSSRNCLFFVQPMYTGGLGRLSVWRLPGGPVGPPARWSATSNIEVGQST